MSSNYDSTSQGPNPQWDFRISGCRRSDLKEQIPVAMQILKKIREAARLTAVLSSTVLGSKPIRCSSLFESSRVGSGYSSGRSAVYRVY